MRKVAMCIAVLFVLGSCVVGMVALTECGGSDPDSPLPPNGPVSPPVAPLQPTDTVVPSPVPTTVPTASLQPTTVPIQLPLPMVVSTQAPQPTQPPLQPPQPTDPPPAVCGCSGDTYNCSDFSTHAKAQACYNYCLQQTGRDVHGLDGNDKDSVVCEGLP